MKVCNFKKTGMLIKFRIQLRQNQQVNLILHLVEVQYLGSRPSKLAQLSKRWNMSL